MIYLFIDYFNNSILIIGCSSPHHAFYSQYICIYYLPQNRNMNIKWKGFPPSLYVNFHLTFLMQCWTEHYAAHLGNWIWKQTNKPSNHTIQNIFLYETIYKTDSRHVTSFMEVNTVIEHTCITFFVLMKQKTKDELKNRQELKWKRSCNASRIVGILEGSICWIYVCISWM